MATITKNEKSGDKFRKIVKAAASIITQEEADKYISLAAQAKEFDKQRKTLGDLLKTKLQNGATVPLGGPLKLVFTEPERMTLSWRDVAYFLCIQLGRYRSLLAKYKIAPTAISASVDDESQIERSAATAVMDQLDAEIPRKATPTLAYDVNTDYIGGIGK